MCTSSIYFLPGVIVIKPPFCFNLLECQSFFRNNTIICDNVFLVCYLYRQLPKFYDPINTTLRESSKPFRVVGSVHNYTNHSSVYGEEDRDILFLVGLINQGGITKCGCNMCSSLKGPYSRGSMRKGIQQG